MKVLYVASEAVPFVKTGGLADVAGSLPAALVKDGVDCRVILPKYGAIADEIRSAMDHIYDGVLNVAWRDKFVGIDRYVLDGVTYYFVDNEEYFNREGFYGYPDDAERFSFLCSTSCRHLISGRTSSTRTIGILHSSPCSSNWSIWMIRAMQGSRRCLRFTT